MMTHTKRPLPRSKRRLTALLLTSSAALAACGPGFERPAGMFVGAGFGNATAINQAANKGQALSRLNDRFREEVETTVLFAFDSSVLTAEARAALDRQADWMRQFPELGFRVYGHADAPGSNAYNEALGLRRAQTVLNYLVSRGVNAGRLEALASFGETRPVVPGPGREIRNRRVVSEVSGFDGRHPGVLNGKYAEVVFREYVESATSPSTLERGGTDGSFTTDG